MFYEMFYVFTSMRSIKLCSDIASLQRWSKLAWRSRMRFSYPCSREGAILAVLLSPFHDVTGTVRRSATWTRGSALRKGTITWLMSRRPRQVSANEKVGYS